MNYWLIRSSRNAKREAPCPRRPDRWWMRWYVVRAIAPSPYGDRGTGDFVECAAATRWGARRLIDWSRNHPSTRTPTWETLRVVRRTDWLAGHP